MTDFIEPPLSLYIHFPWCVAKCPYCDFNSHALKQDLPENAYINALLADLDHLAPQLVHRRLHSIFLGGGTPSLFEAPALSKLLNGVSNYWSLRNVEITLEANPGTVEQQRFIDYRRIGINRLSLGVQSFQDTKLKQLGRIHSGQDAIVAVKMAKEAGFDRINLDLMYALADQSEAELCADLHQAFALAPTHLSWYQLTLEPNTPFYRQPPAALPNDELIADLMVCGQAQLKKAGYQDYEISAYATHPDVWCQHNLNYWTYGDYLGIGAGAHSKLSDAKKQTVSRHHLSYHPKQYLQLHATERISGQHNLNAANRCFEFLLNHLRLQRPMSLHRFTHHTGCSIRSLQPTIKTLYTQGLITYNTEFLELTPHGKLFVNEVMEAFLPEPMTQL